MWVTARAHGYGRTRTLAVLLCLAGAALRNLPLRLLEGARAPARQASVATAASNGGAPPRHADRPPWPRPVRTTLHLLGERHSGTKWMTQHLKDCFGDQVAVVSALSRWKHWFQEDGHYATRDAVVVAQFRHTNRWVEAMRGNPYHSPNHFNLSWREFVTKEWVMDRYGVDRELFELNKTTKEQQWQEPVCQYEFRPYEAIPCVENSTVFVPGFRMVHSLYELRNDASGLPYQSILQLRADKIRNFLSVANFVGVRHLEVVRYEDMAANGTASLIRKLERILGVPATCQPTDPQVVPNPPLPPGYEAYMRDHVDWDTEALLGYTPA